MNKKYIFWIVLIIAVIIGGGIYLYNSTKTGEGKSNFNTSRTSQNVNNTLNNSSDQNTVNNSAENENFNNTTENIISNNISNIENINSTFENNNSTENTTNNTSNLNVNEENNQSSPQLKETEIASFTTKIYTKDSERQNNISIACSTLNDTIVENGKTFSFTDTVGKATSSKGYEKADVFQDGEVVEALGGGMCQVSTTLYNAILKVSNADVTERHSHSNSVPYVAAGKDAAVAYGSYDFKFVNNTR